MVANVYYVVFIKPFKIKVPKEGFWSDALEPFWVPQRTVQ